MTAVPIPLWAHPQRWDGLWHVSWHAGRALGSCIMRAACAERGWGLRQGVPTCGGITCQLMQVAITISCKCMYCQRQLVPSACDMWLLTAS